MSTPRYLVAGQLRFDRQYEKLWNGDAQVRLGGKSLGIVSALMARPQQLVAKDELFDAVWPGLAVSESVLTTAVKEARQALGDSAREPRLIETVHGRGYRFLPEVVETDELAPVATAPAPDTARRRRFALLIAVLTVLSIAVAFWRFEAPPRSALSAPAAHAKSIAVLPFDDLSSTADQRWFADGITEEILQSLARTPDLRVASRTASARYRSPGIDVQAAAEALGVAHVLEGSVRREAGRVRVTAQLIRASDGFHLWAQNYDRPAADVISIQETIAFDIARALKTVLDPAKLRAMLKTGTMSVDAYDAFLRSKAFDAEHGRTGDVELSRRARLEMERARALDPGFARAHWEAAREWFGLETRIDAFVDTAAASEAERLQKYRERLAAAIAAAANAAEVPKYRAAEAVMELNFMTAERLLVGYLKDHPRDIDGWIELVDYAAYSGNRPLMAEAAERLYSLSIEAGDPLSRAITATVMAVRFDDAAKRARRLLGLRPESAVVRYQAHRALLANGDSEEGARLLPSIAAADLPVANKMIATLRQACAEGRVDDAAAIYGRIKVLSELRASSLWNAAMTAGRIEDGEAVLRPLDTPRRHPVLMQYLIFPNFDASRYPLLAARLAREGVVRPRPIRFAFDCPLVK